MTGSTRRSHIVRCYDVDSSGKPDKKGAYADVEVLDAISFKIKNGEEVILNFPAKKAVPYIVDDTGHDLEKQPSNATRRTHVEHIKTKDGELLVEVLDAIAFKDKRGEEWILKMPSKKSSHYNVTDDTGDDKSTMRTHNEKLGSDPKEKDPKDNYITVERTDVMAFRTINGKEMILKMPSNDVGKKPGRADTHIWSPDNNTYDPTDDNPDNAPPENKDPDFYVKFVKDKSPFTGKEKLISQGPLWWIRKIHKPLGSILMITLDVGGFGGCFNTLGVEGEFTVNPFASSLTGAVDWSSDSKDVKLLGYIQNQLEFNSVDETVIFEVPKTGDFNIVIHGQNPYNGGNAVAAIFTTKAKGVSIFEGERLTDSSGGIGTLSQPKPLADTKPQEIDPATCNWAFPSAYTPTGDTFEAKINGTAGTYGVNPDTTGAYGDTLGMTGYSEVLKLSKADDDKSNNDAKDWVRTTKLYAPGVVEDYETVIPYTKGIDTGVNGDGTTFAIYVTGKGGKLKISNQPPPPPPIP